MPSHVSCTPSSIAINHSPPSSPASLLDLFRSPSPSLAYANPNDIEHYLSDSEVDSMLSSAYGESLFVFSSVSGNDWVPRWEVISHRSGNHYFLPKGQCGRRYVSTLCDEMTFLPGAPILPRGLLCSVP